MIKNVNEFLRRVTAKMNDKEADSTVVHQMVEVAYEQCIADQMTKAFFLDELMKQDAEVFALTVNHLFTPINWSRVKLRTLWAIKNLATGNLLTLERDQEEEVFLLKESSENPATLDFAPMMTGNEDDAKMFIKMLTDVSSDAPVGVNDTLISMEIDKRININNLEAVEVKVIF